MALNDGKVEYKNVTQHWVGAQTINRKGDEVAVAIEPGSSIFLSEEECELTARAHKRPQDSPFHPREIVYIDDHTLDEEERLVMAPLTRVDELRAGVAQAPAGEAEEGSFSEHEEVGTPDAAAKAKPRRAAPKKPRSRRPAAAAAG